MKQSNKFLLGIFFLFFFLELLFLTTRHHDIHWDEAVYISMGKWIYSAGQQGLFEALRPWGLSLILGFLWKLHLGTAVSYQLVIFLFALGVLYLTYKIAETLFDSEAALFSTFLLAVTPFFLLGTFSILTEVPTTFFILLTLYFLLQKKHPFWIGISASMAFLFKFPAGILLVVVIFMLLLEQPFQLEKKIFPIISVLIGFLLVQVPYFVMNYLLYKPHTSTVFAALFRPFLLAKEHENNGVYAVAGVLKNIFYYPFYGIWSNPLLVFAIVGIGFVLIKKELRQKATYWLIPFFLFLLYFTWIPNKQIRFAILFVPFVALLAGYGCQKMWNLVKVSKWRKILIFSIILFPLVSLLYTNIFIAYLFFPDAKLPVEKEYYNFFDEKEGTVILTTEPYFAAYTDNILLIPYYNSITDAEETYNRYKKDVDYIVFTPTFYPCAEEHCSQQIAALENDMRKNLEVVYEKEWSGSNKIILKAG